MMLGEAAPVTENRAGLRSCSSSDPGSLGDNFSCLDDDDDDDEEEDDDDDDMMMMLMMMMMKKKMMMTTMSP
eukprot:3412351-Amphidinium_carterae.1